MLGGQSAVSGHLTVGDKVKVAGKSGVINDVEPDWIVAGFPAVNINEWRKNSVLVGKLPEMRKRIIALEKKIEELEDKKV